MPCVIASRACTTIRRRLSRRASSTSARSRIAPRISASVSLRSSTSQRRPETKRSSRASIPPTWSTLALDLLDPGRGHALERRLEQALLAVEVPVDGGLHHARALAHVRDRGAGEAALGEQRDRGGQDPLAAGFALGRWWSRSCGSHVCTGRYIDRVAQETVKGNFERAGIRRPTGWRRRAGDRTPAGSSPASRRRRPRSRALRADHPSARGTRRAPRRPARRRDSRSRCPSLSK